MSLGNSERRGLERAKRRARIYACRISAMLTKGGLNQNCLFLHLPKCGGTSLSEALYATVPMQKQIGVIAQELQKVFPELVAEDDRGFLMVNYQGLVPVLLQAIKEQQQEINQLTDKVASQEAKISAIETNNEEMKSDLELIKKMLKGSSEKTVL